MGGKKYRQAWMAVYDLARMNLTLPDFQRGYVWSPEQARFLVETMLLGLPIGGIVAWVQKDGSELIIDGQQRISTLRGVQMGNGGDVPTVYVDVSGSAPLAVLGSGAWRTPVHSLMSLCGDSAGMMVVAACGLDPVEAGATNTASAFEIMRERGVTFDDGALRRASDASDMIRGAHLPGLVFTQGASRADVLEAFRRINLGGSPIGADELERLTA